MKVPKKKEKKLKTFEFPKKNSLSKILNIETLQKYTHLFYLDSLKNVKRTKNKEKKNMIVGILKLSINTSICPIWAH